MTVSKNASYRQAKSPPGGSLLRHTEKSTKRSTEKSTSQVLPTSQKPTGMQSTETRTLKSTKPITIQLKPPFESTTMKSTGWSPKRTLNNESIPRTNDYRLQEILYRACGSTARRLKRVQAHLNLVSITILGEAHLLGVD